MSCTEHETTARSSPFWSHAVSLKTAKGSSRQWGGLEKNLHHRGLSRLENQFFFRGFYISG